MKLVSVSTVIEPDAPVSTSSAFLLALIFLLMGRRISASDSAMDFSFQALMEKKNQNAPQKTGNAFLPLLLWSVKFQYT